LLSDVIDFLEQCGQDADLRHASREMLEEALRGADIDSALRAAILGKDVRTLEALLGAEPNVCCAIHREEEEEETEDDEGHEDHEDEERTNEVKNTTSSLDLRPK